MTAASQGVALVFPGQGAQAPGMGAEWIGVGAHPELIAAARAFGCDLAQLVGDADETTLRRTENAQPALFYTAWSAAAALLASGVQPKAVAGHSLGEWVAVAAAGALDPVAALELVIRRGQLMAAAPAGAMAAVLGAGRAAVDDGCRAAAAAGEICVVANDNAPGQAVISGTPRGVEIAAGAIRAAGAGKVVPLQVGGAFHSPLMAAAAQAFAERLEGAAFGDPRLPLAANATGTCLRTAGELRGALTLQLDRPVLWVEQVRALAAIGVDTFVECGPGATLSNLIRRILPDAMVHRAGTPAEVQRVAARL
ncbi:MAG TPA: ACP S-malonyltransferase [Verrucomicrobiae bacterium]|nr:ACP S-malonyltransferase [Verrucomicrobiae bacterium]